MTRYSEQRERYNDMTEQEQMTIANNLLEVAKVEGCSRYVLNVCDVPGKLYKAESTDMTHLDEDLSHAYLVNAITDELMSSEALGFHDLVIVYTDNYGYTLMPGRYS